MIDDTDSDELLRKMEIRRLATLVIGSAEVIAFLLLAHLTLMSVDPLDDTVDALKIGLQAVPIVLLTVPGLLLAWMGRAPRLALGFVLLAIPAAVLAWA
jgi:hypothetical protein